MPRYHFDLVDSKTVRDEGGAELPDDIQALDLADVIAGRRRRGSSSGVSLGSLSGVIGIISSPTMRADVGGGEHTALCRRQRTSAMIPAARREC
ncbi:hypothetical protein JJE66_21650 [Bradyrhizobium diazoefficiens]|uniref:DUF6894 family protein n=1 Tax=Bradyrhizobium diazoefficiens TaxID=1355477 RepID=UPI00190A4B96|nr:hypothetical protein [Bradyrhizobium diazoefficiens]MBK3663819.1 hypothetical protein [Bradyrhizobium diazoefficiens]